MKNSRIVRVLALMTLMVAVSAQAQFAKPEAAIKYRQASLTCLLYTSPSSRDGLLSRMPSSA